MATTQYTSITEMSTWPATPAYTASGETPVLVANPDPIDTVFIWHQASATAPTFKPRNGIPIDPGRWYTVTLADGENLFVSAQPMKVVNIVE